MDLCIIGTLAYDSIETPFDHVENALGGSASYIATAASYYTNSIGVVSIVGDDFSKDDLDFLRSRGVDLTGVEVRPGGRTFRWSGRYHFDLNERDTLETQLNVLTEFDPVIPEAMRSARVVCLGNIDPALQLKVLDQMDEPEYVICDTMNFWIEHTPEKLREVLGRVDCVIINDSEARQLVDESNVIRAARKVQKLGPSTVVVKKGEHGALLFIDEDIFSAPAYPLEDIYDPTGAGDTFAGGFAGFIIRSAQTNEASLRRAVIHGSAMASFCVEKFSLDALRDLTAERISARINAFRRLVHFEQDEVGIGDTGS